jgi:pimeloyl-ACP methyl ester carboxylesterase
MENYLDGIRYLTNFEDFDASKPLMVCLHGNSSCAETFINILQDAKGQIQIIAPDLPGCGKSKRLKRYSMCTVGYEIHKFIKSFKSQHLYLFGHSLGEHLLAYIPIKCDGIIIAGTPPLSSPKDFSAAFAPDEEAKKLIPFLAQEQQFTKEQATDFVTHTGVKGNILDLMIEVAITTDGKFRSGCLSTLIDVDQVAQLSMQPNLIVFHAENDGVISKQYLLDHFGDKVHCLQGRHMLPVTHSKEILAVIKDKFHL